MKHPSDELIITFLYNEAEKHEIRLIETHMAECVDCALKINAMKKTINAVNGLNDEETPIFLTDKIAAGFENDRRNIDPVNIIKTSKTRKDKTYGQKTASANKTAAGSVANGKIKKNSFIKTSVIKNENPETSEIMTPGELADFLKIPLEGIYDLLSDIPYLTLAGQIRFRRSSVEKWLEIREKNPLTPKHALRDIDDSPKLWLNVV